MVFPRRISDFKPIFTNLAQTSHYQVIFGGLSTPLRSQLLIRGIDSRFIGETVGLLCDSAVLPGSSFATADIVGNYTGVAEKFAHTRTFTQIDLSFYVDNQYRTLKFFEHWMEFMSSGSNASPVMDGYHYRMQYPSEYKTNTTKIIKFDRDYNAELEYTFYGLFPLTLNSTSVTYGNSEILKATASFSFERYICGRTSSLDIFKGFDLNKIGLNLNTGSKPATDKKLVPVSAGAWGSNGVGAYDGNKYNSLAEAMNSNAVVNISQWNSAASSSAQPK